MDIFHQRLRLLDVNKAAGGDVRSADDGIGVKIDGGDYDEDAVLRQMLAVAQHRGAHIAHAVAVHKDLAGGHRLPEAHAALVQLDDAAGFRNEDAVFGHPQFARDGGVLDKMAVFAVYRNKIVGLDKRVDELQFFPAGMSRDVHVGNIVVQHVDAALIQLVDDIGDRLLIAGNRR